MPETAPDSSETLVLYDYWRSSASYRVRIALNLKGLSYEQRSVNLVKDGGEQHFESYREVNPQGLVPALVHGDRVLTQSLAICEYLDAVFEGKELLPRDPYLAANVRAQALTIACDIHPLNNLRVQNYLKGHLGASPDQAVIWMNHWVSAGFGSVEAQLQKSKSKCLWGDEPGLFECFLIPQVYNAERFDCDLSAFPAVTELTEYCRSLSAFINAAPQQQADAPNS